MKDEGRDEAQAEAPREQHAAHLRGVRVAFHVVVREVAEGPLLGVLAAAEQHRAVAHGAVHGERLEALQTGAGVRAPRLRLAVAA